MSPDGSHRPVERIVKITSETYGIQCPLDHTAQRLRASYSGIDSTPDKAASNWHQLPLNADSVLGRGNTVDLKSSHLRAEARISLNLFRSSEILFLWI